MDWSKTENYPGSSVMTEADSQCNFAPLISFLWKWSKPSFRCFRRNRLPFSLLGSKTVKYPGHMLDVNGVGGHSLFYLLHIHQYVTLHNNHRVNDTTVRVQWAPSICLNSSLYLVLVPGVVLTLASWRSMSLAMFILHSILLTPNYIPFGGLRNVAVPLGVGRVGRRLPKASWNIGELFP